VILSLRAVFGIEFGMLLPLREKAYLPPVTMVTLGAMVDKLVYTGISTHAN
jgi:hypothetical protein